MTHGKRTYRQLAQLVERAQAGDTEAFAELYRRTAQAQYFMLVGQVGEEDAKDLLQEMYAIAWNNIQDIRPHAFVSYLGSVGRNLCLQHFRRASSAATPTDSERDLADAAEAAAEHSGTEAPDAFAKIDAAERRERLVRALREDLDDRERQMVLMRYYQDMKVGDIAEELGVSRNTVRNVLNQALASLRRKVGAIPFGMPFAAVLADAVETPPAPGAVLRGRGASAFDWATRAVAASVFVVAVGGLGLAAAAPAPETEPAAPEETVVPDQTPAAPKPASPTPAEPPRLAATQVRYGQTGLTVEASSGTAEVRCIAADGTAYEAIEVERTSEDAPTSIWWFNLPSGTYDVTLKAQDGTANTGTVTCDIPPMEPDLAQS